LVISHILKSLVSVFLVIVYILLCCYFFTCNGTKWPKLCLCAVKKLLTHSLCAVRHPGRSILTRGQPTVLTYSVYPADYLYGAWRISVCIRYLSGMRTSCCSGVLKLKLLYNKQQRNNSDRGCRTQRTTIFRTINFAGNNAALIKRVPRFDKRYLFRWTNSLSLISTFRRNSINTENINVKAVPLHLVIQKEL